MLPPDIVFRWPRVTVCRVLKSLKEDPKACKSFSISLPVCCFPALIFVYLTQSCCFCILLVGNCFIEDSHLLPFLTKLKAIINQLIIKLCVAAWPGKRGNACHKTKVSYIQPQLLGRENILPSVRCNDVERMTKVHLRLFALVLSSKNGEIKH